MRGAATKGCGLGRLCLALACAIASITPLIKPVMMLRLFLLAALLLVHGEARAETPAEKAGFAPRLIIYNARGPANSCGPGCDRWIAVEGQVD